MVESTPKREQPTSCRKTDAEQLLMEYGFMQEVEKRAQEVISSMIGAMGYKGYDIAFRGFQQVIPANHHQLENKHMENMEWIIW